MFLTRAVVLTAAVVVGGLGAAAPANAAPVNTADAAAAAGCYHTSSRPTISYGSTGAAVRQAQCLLNGAGYYGLEVDGIFGTYTSRAVQDFQSCKRLAVDGIVGPNTWAALYSGRTGDCA